MSDRGDDELDKYKAFADEVKALADWMDSEAYAGRVTFIDSKHLRNLLDKHLGSEVT